MKGWGGFTENFKTQYFSITCKWDSIDKNYELKILRLDPNIKRTEPQGTDEDRISLPNAKEARTIFLQAQKIIEDDISLTEAVKRIKESK